MGSNRRVDSRKRMSAYLVYLILQCGSSLFFSLYVTVYAVYQVTVVGLSPLALVLMGTILEATIFIFEIPTGVLADVKSRRLSIIVGCLLWGLGLLIEGSAPFFWTVALAQVIWGFGYTFISGATEAWIVDEVGDERAGQAFLRGAQAGQIGDLLAVPIGVALGSIAVRLPILVSGSLMILLGIFLAVAMPEEGFTPTPAGDRTTWRLMLKTMKSARRLVRRQPVLLTVLGIGLFYGLYSEGLDRLWTPHVLESFAMSLSAVLEPVALFGIIRAVLLVISLVATEVVRRRIDTTRSASLSRVLMINAGFIVVALAGFALTRSFWVALVLYWLVGTLRAIRWPLHSAWFNQRIDDSQVRATMFSIGSQIDAIGQVCGGPMVGAIGNAVSIRAALIASALLLSPVLPLYSRAIRRGGPTSGSEPSTESSGRTE